MKLCTEIIICEIFHWNTISRKNWIEFTHLLQRDREDGMGTTIKNRKKNVLLEMIRKSKLFSLHRDVDRIYRSYDVNIEVAI